MANGRRVDVGQSNVRRFSGLLCSKLCRTPETFPATMRDGLSSAEAWKRWPCSTRSSSAGLFSALRVGMVATLAAQPSPADAASYRSTDRPPAHRCVWVCLNGDVTPRAAQTAPLGPCLSSSHPCTPIADCAARVTLAESKAFELGALQRDPTDAAQEASRVNDEHSEACFRHRHR